MKHAFEAGVEDHNPDLYKPQGFAPSLESPAMLDDQQVELYHQQGYLSIANLLDGFKVQQAIAALIDLIQGHNSDFNGLLYEAAARNPTVMNDLSGRYDLIRKVFNFVQFDERLQALASDPTLLSLVSRLMHGRTPKLFQDMPCSSHPRWT
ncbi:MAG: hypothetical protein HC898_07395 [Phycisphaerales bacterium]|nr:hypothetical protein [Phycisphaerales bacterium]